MSIREIIEKGQNISAKRQAEAALARAQQAEERRRRAYNLRDDPRPLGFRRPDTSADLIPGRRVHIVERFEQLIEDPDHVETFDLLVERWCLVALDDFERRQYKHWGTTHKLVAILAGRGAVTEWRVSDLLYNHGVTAWIKL